MNNAKITFHVLPRTLEEKNSDLRHTGYTLGNVFGLQKNSQTIKVNSRQLAQHLKNEGENGLLYLVIEDNTKEEPVLIDEIQRHPVTREVGHITFKRVNLSEKITQEVPVRLEGLFEVKDATVLLVRDNLEIEALPTDLPEDFVVDISTLTEVGQEVRVSDLAYDRVKITVQVTEEDENPLLAIVQEVKEEVVEEPVVEPVEGEEGAPAEGEAGEADVADETAQDE